jgi:hypothetical protein
MERPDELYRLESSSSVSRFNEEDGIIAGDPTWHPNDFDDNAALETALGQHLDWGNRNYTPFISMSDSRYRTLNNAKKRACDPGETNIRIITILPDMVEAAGGEVMNVKEGLDKRGLMVPEHVRRWVTTTEYVAQTEIPPYVVTNVLGIADFTGGFPAPLAQLYFLHDKSCVPKGHGDDR